MTSMTRKEEDGFGRDTTDARSGITVEGRTETRLNIR